MFAAVLSDLGRSRDWLPATAPKKADHFKVIFDNSPSEVIQYFFEDERKSLLSENLWEIGWYKLLGDPSPLTDAVTASRANEVRGFGLGKSPANKVTVSIIDSFKGNCF